MAMLLTSRRRSSWTDRDHLRAALDGLPVCAIVCDLDLTVVHASDLARTSWPRWCDPGRHAAAPAATAGAPLLPQPMERPMPQPMEGPMQQPMPQQADPIGVRLTQLHGDPDEVRRVCAAAATEPQRLTLTVGAWPLEATIGPARVATGGVAGGVAGGVIGYVIVLADPAERRADLSGPRHAGARVQASVDQAGRLGADVETTAGAVTAHSDRLSDGVEELITLMSSVADGADLIRSSTLAVVDSAHSATVSVTELHDASARIGEFTALITSIAEQTKLLALNATIEATRAGAAGSGFAVVAKEVKDLAQRSRNATEEVSGIIEAIQAGSKAAGTALDTIVERVDVVGEQQLTVNAIVDKQVAQVDEIATIARDLSGSVGELNGAVGLTRESLASLAEHTDALDEELRAAAE